MAIVIRLKIQIIFLQEIGLASLGASDKDIDNLASVSRYNGKFTCLMQ